MPVPILKSTSQKVWLQQLEESCDWASSCLGCLSSPCQEREHFKLLVVMLFRGWGDTCKSTVRLNSHALLKLSEIKLSVAVIVDDEIYSRKKSMTLNAICMGYSVDKCILLQLAEQFYIKPFRKLSALYAGNSSKRSRVYRLRYTLWLFVVNITFTKHKLEKLSIVNTTSLVEFIITVAAVFIIKLYVSFSQGNAE